MGNTKERVQGGIDQVVGVLAGAEMLDKLKTSILNQNVFQTMFGKITNPKNRIFTEKVPAYNETILPLWEFQPITDIVQGAKLHQTGVVNSRILFPNNLSADFKIYRLTAMIVSRFMTSTARITDFLKEVPGLIEFGENIEYSYQQVLTIGEMTTPALVMSMPYTIDLNRMRIEDGCTDLDGDLDALLLAEMETYFLTITDDKEVVEDRTVLLDKQPLPVGD